MSCFTQPMDWYYECTCILYNLFTVCAQFILKFNHCENKRSNNPTKQEDTGHECTDQHNWFGSIVVVYRILNTNC